MATKVGGQVTNGRAGMEDRLLEPYRNLKFKPGDELGVGGAVITDGFLLDREKDNRLVGSQRYITYSDIIANTSIVGTGVRRLLGLVVKTSWSWEPADDTPQAQDVADFVEDCFVNMLTPWNRVVQRAAMFRFYGFALAEWIAKKRDDGRIGYLDIQARPQSTIYRWFAERSGTVLGVMQLDPQTGEEILIPRGKMFYCVDDSIDFTPQGMGLLRHVVSTATALERYEQLEGWGFETDLRGIPIGRAPLAKLKALADSDPSKAAAISAQLEPLKNFLKGHIKSPKLSILLDSLTYQGNDAAQTPSAVKEWDITMMTGNDGASTTQAEVSTAIMRLNQECARILGCEDLLLGADAVGSRALGQSKAQNVAQVVDGIMNGIRESVDSDLILPLLRMNGMDEALAPKSRTETVQLRDVDQITTGLRDMAVAGAVIGPDDPVVDYVRGLFGLPEQLSTEVALAQSDAALTSSRSTGLPSRNRPLGEAPSSSQQKADTNAAKGGD